MSLGLDGRPLAPRLVPLVDEGGRAGVEHVTPMFKRSGKSAPPVVPHDRLDYVLGWCDKTGDPSPQGLGAIAKAERAHQAYREAIRDWAATDGDGDPIAQAVAAFVLGGHASSIGKPDVWSQKDNVLLVVDGVSAHLAASIPSYWVRYVDRLKARSHEGTCLVCGEKGRLVATIPQMVKGGRVPGGDKSGVAPISVNKAAFGYDLTTQLAHVPVCTSCARAIPTALNSILGDERRRRRTDDTATAWWIRGKSDLDPLDMIDQPREADVAALIGSIESGRAISAAIEPDRFNCMVVSGNGPRLIVHDWTSMPVQELMANVARWFVDIEIEPEWLDQARFAPLWLLATASGRFDREHKRYLPLGDPKGRHPHGIAEELRRTALHGSNPTSQLAIWVISRVAADQHVDAPRAALLRLALRRTYSKGDLMPGLDPSCADPCYVAGRLFAEYAQIQYAAATMDEGKAPNSTFADKNFAGAISNPAIAIAAGEKQAAGWLSKLRRKGWDGPHIRTLDSLVDLLDPAVPLPTRATIEQQSMFVLGYHHQRAHSNRAREAAKQAKLAGQTNTNPEQGDSHDTH